MWHCDVAVLALRWLCERPLEIRRASPDPTGGQKDMLFKKACKPSVIFSNTVTENTCSNV